MSDDATKFEFTGPGGIGAKLGGKRIAEMIAVLLALMVGWIGWVLWEHHGEARRSNEMLSSAIRELAQSQREMACVILKRGTEPAADLIAVCKQISRMQ